MDAPASPETGTPMQGGRQIAVTVPDSAHTLTVTVEHGGAWASHSLALVPREPVAALEKAEALRQANPEQARALLLPLLSEERAWVRGRALGRLARIERDIDRKKALFDEAMDLHRKARRISEEVKDGVTLVTALLGNRRFAEARSVLARIEPLGAQFPEGRSLALHYRARLASSVGDLRAALRLFDASKEIAERLDFQAHLADVVQFEAEVLLTLGRSADAMALDERGDTLSRRAKPCQRAQFLDNSGWHAVLAAESLAGLKADVTDPRPKLREALALYQGPCNQPGVKRNALTNLAISSIDLGRVDEARDYLDKARQVLQSPDGKPAAEPDDETEAWWSIVEARIALAIGEPAQALRSYNKSAEISARASLPDLRVRAALGQAKALNALGRSDAARKAYADADVLLDSWSHLAPLGEGRETFLARYEASTRERVDFLLRQAEREREPAGWIKEAATAARTGRARILGSLQWLDRLDALSPSEHARWDKAVTDYRLRLEALRVNKAKNDRSLPGDALTRAAQEEAAENKRLHDAFEEALSMAPRSANGALVPAPRAPGEVMLLCQPVQGGWVGFAITRDRTVFRRLAEKDPGAPPEQVATQLLDSFSDVLEGATQIRFAPHGRLSGVDFHKLPWRGRRLLDRFTVTYGVDLPRERSAAPASSHPPLAILVANPLRDAPGTSRAARSVAAALEESGWRVQLIEHEAATHDVVRAALGQPGVELFFYAGHGRYQGRDGWESGLRLADDVRFTVADVMALSRVPPRVVLSGCETAKAADDTPVEGLGLAQAFVVAGANEVVATVRPVEDKLAERVMRALYNKEEGGALLPGRDLPAALWQAQRVVATDPEAGDWAAFRVLVP
jgi:tetratricopeptide (TPR) repeat protein